MRRIKNLLPGMARSAIITLCLLFRNITVNSLLESLKGSPVFLPSFYCGKERFSLNERFSLMKGRTTMTVRLTSNLNQACETLKEEKVNLSQVARTCLKDRVNIDDYLKLFGLYLRNLNTGEKKIRTFNLSLRTIDKMNQINQILKSFSKTVTCNLCLLFQNLTVDGLLQRIKGNI